jgi:very-short-patch-repair endonuclease/Cdc6-like AAA superfamily ATPase
MANESPPVAVDPRKKVLQVFRYLEALNRHRNPVVRLASDQPWLQWLDELPKHRDVVLRLPQPGDIRPELGDDGGDGEDATLLRVRRPKVTEPPAPPRGLDQWLTTGWQDPDWKIGTQPTMNLPLNGETITVAFGDDPRRVEALAAWSGKWSAWAEAERPEREAFALFDRLYTLFRDFERESGKFELLVADGHLLWKHSSGDIRHPVLLQKASLSFDPQVPEFLVELEDGQEAQLYEALLTSLEEVAPARLRELSDELRGEGLHPLGAATTQAFLKRVALALGSDGDLSDGAQDAPLTEHARIARRPLLIMRNKSHGLAASLAAIISDLENAGEISPALLRIVGVETPIQDAEQREVDPLAVLAESEEILLGKPSNREQVQIADRLQRHGCVLVQGPPGTGKTHTIGNLIGHLLAQGKKVLVTSHGTKALRVLRRQIPEPLQHLCVSVLDDADSKRQLEVSIGGIAERLGEADPDALEREARSLHRQRRDLIAQLTETRRRLMNARADEYRELVLEGVGIAPSAAAREAAEKAVVDSWVPGPLVPGRALPLGEGEVVELYSSNRDVPVEDEQELELGLPDAQALPSAEVYERLLSELQMQREAAHGDQPGLWTPVQALSPGHLKAVHAQLERVLEPLFEDEPWRLEALESGGLGGEALTAWHELFELIQQTHCIGDEARALLLTHDPAPKEGQRFDAASELQLVSAIRAHIEAGKSMGNWSLLFRGAWKKVLERWTLATGPVASGDQARAVELWLRLSLQRQTLRGRWDRQLGPLGAPPAASLGAEPEKVCMQYLSRFEKDLAWHEQEWLPLVKSLQQVGLRWSDLLEAEPPVLSAHPALRRRASAAQRVPALLEARAAVLRIVELESELGDWSRLVEAQGGAASASRTVRVLAAALSRQDPAGYSGGRTRLVELLGRRAILARRRELLARLEPFAPAWAAAIRARNGAHGQTEPPGSAVDAWRWRQLNEELDRRAQVQLDVLQEAIERLAEKLRETTTALIDRLGWAAQVKRSTQEQRMALLGWLGLQRRIGKAKGKRAPTLQAAATRQMATCRTAVPVWVMTLGQAALSFDASTRFDVVIIDEASQSDVMALAGLYLGRQVVVVGDHEQVSPSAVGQNLGTVQRLIDTHLEGIPNHQLYDGQLSVYELARQAFGGLVRLREHFRCVPDIIGFSNRLSYDNSILPLRDRTSSSLLAAVQELRVANGVKDDKLNREEARATAALIAAASRHPAYEGKSFGVISMVGEEQALEIERLLRQKLPPAEVERRHLLCGNASQFQGDERDVMFLSMVDSGGTGPLTMRSSDHLMFKQRFNVAASRARDQMWVVHSLDPATDLRSGDLRRLLLEHCRDPNPGARELECLLSATESPFEKEVLQRLLDRGYKVTPQWPVGSFRIDLVVTGHSTKLAVECDGDRYHPLEKLPEDMARQAILERLGWRFVRIRGSAFFRDAEAAMAPIFKRLKELGIEPGQTEAAAPVPPAADSIRRELVRDMEQMLDEWLKDGDEVIPSRPVRRGWGRRAASEVVPSEDVPVPAPSPKAPDTPRQSPKPRAVARDIGEVLLAPVKAARPVAATPSSLKKTLPSKDPFVDALLAALPASADTCPSCENQMPLKIGRFGPFIQCANASCDQRASVQMSVISAALKTLPAVCQCGAPLKVARAASVFLGCSAYPDCRNSVGWKEFRDNLRRTAQPDGEP